MSQYAPDLSCVRCGIYESQLEEDLKPSVAPHVDQRGTFYMLRVSRGMDPGTLREDEHAGIWIWSDLHLGHTETLHAFGRPFETAAEMDESSASSRKRSSTLSVPAPIGSRAASPHFVQLRGAACSRPQ